MTMRRIRTATVSFIILLMLVPTFAQASEPVASDVVIYGATPAGIAAALTAAGGECSVLLIEPAGTVNTGDAGGDMTAPPDAWV